MTPSAPRLPGAVMVVFTATAATPERFSLQRLLVKSMAATAVVLSWFRVAVKTRRSGVPFGWKCPPSSTSPDEMSYISRCSVALHGACPRTSLGVLRVKSQ